MVEKSIYSYLKVIEQNLTNLKQAWLKCPYRWVTWSFWPQSSYTCYVWGLKFDRNEFIVTYSISLSIKMLYLLA